MFLETSFIVFAVGFLALARVIRFSGVSACCPAIARPNAASAVRPVRAGRHVPAGTAARSPGWDAFDGRPGVVPVAEKPLALTLVEDGRIIDGNLERIGRDVAWLLRELRRQGYEGCRNIFYAEWSGGTVKVYSYVESGPTFPRERKRRDRYAKRG